MRRNIYNVEHPNPSTKFYRKANEILLLSRHERSTTKPILGGSTDVDGFGDH